MKPTVAQLKVTLYRGEANPAVVRRLEVPFDIDLDRLHQTIHASLAWRNDDLYEFLAGDVRWGIPDPNAPDFWIDSRKTSLADVIEMVGRKGLKYIYDLIETMEYSIEIERLAAPEPGVDFPRLTAATGRRPSESDWGRDELAIIDDPCHERHSELVEWMVEDKRLCRADKKRLADRVAALPGTWSTRPAAE